jgi:periplasmic protein TonB
MACLKESALQGYLEELGSGPFRQMVESRLASCARCRAAFDRVVATNRRVNSWLAKLSSHADTVPCDSAQALGDVMSRVEAASSPFAFLDIGGRSTNPMALVSSFVFQGAIIAILMLIGTSAAVRTKIIQTTLLAPPPVQKPAQPRTGHSGGGGQHSPLPPLKGQLPKPAAKVFTAPLVTVEHPALVMDASLIAPADAWAVPTSAIGNPLGVIGGAGGPGEHGGIGKGVGPGIGDLTDSGTGGSDDAGIYILGNGVTAPSVLSKVDPEYSEEARKAKYSGAVLLSIVVNTDGQATDIRIVKSLGMGLDEKAIEAVQQWRFKPGTNKGTAVRVRAQIEVNFRLL